MPWFPGCIRKEVTRHRTLRTHDRGVCLHIAVSEGASLFNYFNQPGNPTSHFYVRYDGDVEQYVDTKYRAPANLEGNPTMISVETQGGVQPNQKWTPQQVETLAQLCAWCHQVHPDIPLIPMPSSRPAATGIGYHRLGVNPWRVDGGELWSKSNGKECPEDQRIAQIPGIITRARAIDAGDTEAPVTDEEIAKVAAAVWAFKVGPDTDKRSVGTIQFRLDPGSDGIAATIRDEPWTKMTTSALDGSAVSVLDLVRFAQGDASKAANKTIDVAALAAEIVAALPPNPDVQAACEAGIRAVLGGLDETP